MIRTLLRRYVIPTMLVSAGFVGGSIFGFVNGSNAFALIDAAPRGALAVDNLKALANGQTGNMRILLENEVDLSLAFYSIASETWWFPLYQSGLLPVDPKQTESYVQRTANYRKANPSLNHKEMFDQPPEGKEQYTSEYKELALGIREHLRRVDEMVEKYADK